MFPYRHLFLLLICPLGLRAQHALPSDTHLSALAYTVPDKAIKLPQSDTIKWVQDFFLQSAPKDFQVKSVNPVRNKLIMSTAYKGQDIVNMPILVHYNKREEVQAMTRVDWNKCRFPDAELSAQYIVSDKDIKSGQKPGKINPKLCRFAQNKGGILNFEPCYRLEVFENERLAECLFYSARSGKLYYRHEIKVACHPGQNNPSLITSAGFRRSPAHDIEPLPLKYLKAELGPLSLYTDHDGRIDLPTVFGGLMRFSLEGRYVSVRNAAQSGVVSSALIPLSSVGSVLSLDSWFSGLETSAYYSANEIHDFARRYFSHSRLDSVQGININLSPSLCNAFYDGVDINFFAPTATCQSLAYLSDVVYHEYGHMIGMSYYREHDYYFYNAALNEAFADVWALVLNDDPVVGEEYNQKNPYEFIRRYNDEPKDMSTLNGLAHHDGEIVAGALWDLYSSLGQDSAVFMPLFRSMMDGFQGLYPSGMEKEAYRAVLLDLLLADDNNGNIFDGTPHGAQIVQAFARHGIYLGEKPIMRIASEYDSSSSALSLYAKVVLSAYPLELQTKVFVYMGGLEDSSLHKIYLEKQGPGEYGLELNLNKPDVYRFIYVLEDNLGGILASDPPMAELPGDIAFYYQAHQMAVVHENSYTIDSGNEGAESSPDLVSGAWQWGETKGAMYDVGSAQSVSAPYFTPGNNDRRAWQTQIEDRDLAYPGAADVDAGYTDLILEPVHLEPGSKYVLGFDYWFHKSGENRADSTDFIEFWVRENEGPWTRLYRNHHSWAAWRAFKYALQTEDGASLSLQLKVRVQDSEGIYEYAQESVVEGAIDNFELRKASGVSVGIDRVSDVRYSGPYPNPGNDYFMVPGNKQCKVYDAQGRLVKALNQSGESVNKVSSVDWAPGIYMIHVAGETENVYKWIKKP